MSFTIKIEPEALQDIQENVDGYNEQQPGLGHEFHIDVKATFKKIKSNPYFQVRYDNVRCLPMKNILLLLRQDEVAIYEAAIQHDHCFIPYLVDGTTEIGSSAPYKDISVLFLQNCNLPKATAGFRAGAVTSLFSMAFDPDCDLLMRNVSFMFPSGPVNRV